MLVGNPLQHCLFVRFQFVIEAPVQAFLYPTRSTTVQHFRSQFKQTRSYIRR